MALASWSRLVNVSLYLVQMVQERLQPFQRSQELLNQLVQFLLKIKFSQALALKTGLRLVSLCRQRVGESLQI